MISTAAIREMKTSGEVIDAMAKNVVETMVTGGRMDRASSSNGARQSRPHEKTHKLPAPDPATAIVPPPLSASNRVVNAGADVLDKKTKQKRAMKTNKNSKNNGAGPQPESVDDKTAARIKHWISELTAPREAGIKAIVAEGRILKQAMAEFEPIKGAWGRFLKSDKLPYRRRAVEMRMAIADHPVLSAAHNYAQLPSAWVVLYYLSHVPDLEAQIKNGTVNVNTSLQEAKKLAGKGPTPSAPTGRKLLARLVKTYKPLIEKGAEDWDIETIDEWIAELQSLVRKLSDPTSQDSDSETAPAQKAA